jgi:hypothetical protein
MLMIRWFPDANKPVTLPNSVVGAHPIRQGHSMSSQKLPVPVLVLFAVFFWLSAIVLNVVAGRVENGEVVRIFALIDALAAAAITFLTILRSLKKD